VAQTLKVRKGDTVQVMKGKDRGKQGRVIEADPKHGRVLVENINMIIRHQRLRPIQNSARRSSRAAASRKRRRCRSRT
jgi:large subunit ribosomal protein L24